jgi:glycosyltransferase involved in cell wall biosynthesis
MMMPAWVSVMSRFEARRWGSRTRLQAEFGHHPDFADIGMGKVADKPLVSTIIIFLNAEEFLQEAIESVLAQTYDRWELLLVDDGSTDGGTAIARRYARQHPDRVRYLEHPGHENRGMSAARNLGIWYARGEYVAFLDADDMWLAQKLEQQVALLEAHPEAGMLCGASLYWYSWTKRPEDAARDEVVPVGAPQDTLLRPPALPTLLYPLGEGSAPCVASLLVRRQVVEAVGGFEDSFRGIDQLYEDQAFLTKIYLMTPVFVSSVCCDRYRRHATSCVSSVTAAGHYRDVRRRFLVWYEGYLLAQGEKDSQVWSAVQGALMPYRHPTRFFLAELRRGPVVQLKRLVSGIGRRAIPASVYLRLRARWNRRPGRPGLPAR